MAETGLDVKTRSTQLNCAHPTVTSESACYAIRGTDLTSGATACMLLSVLTSEAYITSRLPAQPSSCDSGLSIYAECDAWH
eukprot:2883306-Rhodomonas_salina.2